MVLATQTLLQRDPKTYEVRVDGRLTPGVSAKDIILALIARIGIGGGTGHVFEYSGEAIRGADDGTADDHLQHEHRGRRARGADRPRRHDLRVPARPPARATGRGLGRGGRAVAAAADRRRRDVRQVDRDRRRHARADGHLRHEPGDGHPDHQPRPEPGRPGRPGPAPGAGAGARVHGPAAGPADPRPEGRRRVRRELHERPDQRPAPGRRRARGPPHRGRRAADGRAGLRRGEARGRASRASTGSSRPPAPTGARPAARCASP